MYHELNVLKTRNVLSHSLEAHSPRLRRLQGHAPPEDTRERPVVGLSPNFWWFLGLWQLNSSSYVAFSLCTCLCSDLPLVIRTPIMLE